MKKKCIFDPYPSYNFLYRDTKLRIIKFFLILGNQLFSGLLLCTFKITIVYIFYYLVFLLYVLKVNEYLTKFLES